MSSVSFSLGSFVLGGPTNGFYLEVFFGSLLGFVPGILNSLSFKIPTIRWSFGKKSKIHLPNFVLLRFANYTHDIMINKVISQRNLSGYLEFKIDVKYIFFFY